MPEVIFTGPAGRIEGRYHPARQKNAPIGIVLHPHPQFGGTMNHQIVYQIYYAFVHRGFSALRFNFRGVGRAKAASITASANCRMPPSALDWAQSVNTEARSCWIAGFSFGAWIGMQLLMRRPEIEGFISIAPPANLYDFSFLAPCPSSGLIIHGDKDAVVPHRDVTKLVEKLKTQKGIVIEQKVVPGANHFFDGKVEPLMQSIGGYLDKRLGKTGRTTTRGVMTRRASERACNRPPRSFNGLNDKPKRNDRGDYMRHTRLIVGCLCHRGCGWPSAPCLNAGSAAAQDTSKSASSFR